MPIGRGGSGALMEDDAAALVLTLTPSGSVTQVDAVNWRETGQKPLVEIEKMLFDRYASSNPAINLIYDTERNQTIGAGTPVSGRPEVAHVRATDHEHTLEVRSLFGEVYIFVVEPHRQRATVYKRDRGSLLALRLDDASVSYAPYNKYSTIISKCPWTMPRGRQRNI